MIEKTPFLHEYSKDTNPEERSTLAEEIRSQRETERELSDYRDAAELLREDIEQKRESFWSRLTHFRDISAKGSELSTLEIKIAEIEEGLDLEDPRTKIANFYKAERQRFIESGHDPEEIRELFSPEHLSEVTTEDYQLLLQKYPGRIATHVTRQGIRTIPE